MKRLLLLLVGLFAVLAVTAGAAYMNHRWILDNLPSRLLYPALRAVFGYRLEANVMIPVRDGVRLATNLYFPTRRSPPLATVLMRTPYDKDNHDERHSDVLLFLRNGYVVAVQDQRGKFHSEGEFTVYRGDSEDGSDTVDWLARQSWSNGRVGTFGCSSAGETQMLLARQRNAQHAAMIAGAAGAIIGSAAGRYALGGFEGGIFNLDAGFGWFVQSGGKMPGAGLNRTIDYAQAVRSLPLIDMVRKFRSDPTDFEDFVSHPPGDPYWRELGMISDEDRFATPSLVMNTWHDPTVGDTLVLANVMNRNWVGGSAHAKQNVIIAPGLHCDFWSAAQIGRVGDLPVGKAAAQRYNELFVAWFDYWLRGEEHRKPDLAPFHFYVLGEDRWADSNEWPPSGVAHRRWYLNGERPANSANGGGTLALSPPDDPGRYDEFRYDPDNPVMTVGGPICCTDNAVMQRPGPVDQHEVESRQDVLVYTSPPLTDGLRIAGPLNAELYISSSAKDTDFVVKLVDVRPDGKALNIQEGALRMRYRDSFTSPTLMHNAEVYLARVDMRAIAYYLAPGHRLRLQISSSNFPRLERNLNTGGRNFDETAGVIAINRVHTARGRASSVIIPEWPVIPAGASAAPAARTRTGYAK